MKKIVRSLYYKLNNILQSTLFRYLRFVEYRKFGKYEFPYKKGEGSKKIHILCTGPSMKKDVAILLKDRKFNEEDKLCVNFFLYDKSIFDIKPSVYCFAHMMFFTSHKNFLEELNKLVDWDMKLFFPLYGVKELTLIKCIITNPRITLCPISCLTYRGDEAKRYDSWKKGESVPSYVNISIMAEYIAINMGYTDIRLYGVEHTFFDDMTVDDDNQLCQIFHHMYGDEKTCVTGFYGEKLHIKDWIYDKYLTFLEHERMREYADYLGVRIINCTRNSLIDAYVRIAQIEIQNENKDTK